MVGTCHNDCPLGAWGFRRLATDSGKFAYYTPTTVGAECVFASTEASLVPDDRNNASDVFLWLGDSGQVELVSRRVCNLASATSRGQTYPGTKSISGDGRFVAFCRAKTGGLPAVWVMDADGRNQRLLSRGVENKGADHPRWLPVPLQTSGGRPSGS